MNDIEISIICNTYNQVLYIEKALDSLVVQKTSVPYEIIVHDDNSMDGTLDVIREFEKKYPNLVRVFAEKENQYSSGKNITRDILLPHIQGEYIALCEGDDYWIDDAKIQKQWEMMQQHEECDMCACRSVIVEESGKNIIGEVRPNKCDGILTSEKVIAGGGRYIATPSLFYRKSLYDKKTKFESVLSFDYTLQIKGSLRGGIYYIDDTMAAYRDLAKGSWSVNVARDKDKIKKHNIKEIKMLEVLDDETERKYHAVISERIKHGYVPFFDQLQMNSDRLYSNVSFDDEIYLWGLGMRGMAFEEFCAINGIRLYGICDKKNENIGETSAFGNMIFDCEYVLKKARTIFASTEGIYKALVEKKYNGRIVNLQEYMPWG